jgi:hypothetical protein
MARSGFGVSVIPLFVSVAPAQNPPQSDPQAVAFASQSIAALTGGSPISDVTLTGSVTWSGGTTTETGTATLLASGTGESRMNFVLREEHARRFVTRPRAWPKVRIYYTKRTFDHA